MTTIPVLEDHRPTRRVARQQTAVHAQRRLRRARQSGLSCERGRLGLRQVLVVTDGVSALTAWSAAVWLERPAQRPGTELLTAALLTAATLVALASRRLYQARVAQFRSQEIQQLGHVAVLTGVVAAAVSHWTGVLPLRAAAAGAALSFATLLLGRSLYRRWIDEGRRAGRFHRQIVLLGANEEAEQLLQLISEHPELGLTPVGVVGAPVDYHRLSFTVPLLGDTDGAGAALEEAGVKGVLVAATAFSPPELNALVRELLSRHLHVQLSSGLFGIAHSRLRAHPLAHEPLFYVEPARNLLWQRVVKRALDIVLGSVLLVLSAPVMALAAFAIKLEDRGPVFFRHARVGRGGRTFQMVKLRTMVPGAQHHYEELAPTLAARSGPLVKLYNDPRMTRVGRFLRATSIDELPQLAQVVAGTMSLIGPRPNLVEEVPGLDSEYLELKTSVRPGITGLWQVEARDNPSFNTYRRLDLFYLENWSLSLDLAVLFATFEHLLARLQVAFRRSHVTARAVLE